MSGITLGYKNDARHLLQGDIDLFLQGPDPPDDANILGHPPGYPIFMAAVFRVFGNSDTSLQLIQIICDGIATVLVLLITVELLPFSVACISSLLIAVSPQLSFYSPVLLPDSLSASPILGAMYLLAKTNKRHRTFSVFVAGALIGVSCWLRANGLLLAFWIGLFSPLIFERGRRVRQTAVLILAMIGVIAPITIRNAMVFHHFVPVSLGAGWNLEAGIADYDTQLRFGLPATDVEAVQMERARDGRPDYVGLYGPNGFRRERARFATSLSIMGSHPLWFAGVMLHRMGYMLRYERTPLVSSVPTVTHEPATEGKHPEWLLTPKDIIARGSLGSAQTNVSMIEDNHSFRLEGDSSGWGDQIISRPIEVARNFDYVLRFPVIIEQGRSICKIVEADSGSLLGSGYIPDPYTFTGISGGAAGETQVPFVSNGADRVRIAFSNDDSHNIRPVLEIGEMAIFKLGGASYLWTYYPRPLIRLVQKFFITAWLIPLLFAGIIILGAKRQYRTLSILLAIPTYFLCVHAPLHVERRYVLAIQYFNFIFVAVALYWISKTLWRGAREIRTFVIPRKR